MGAEAFEVKFGENKSIAIGVSFSKGDAIQVPVSINSLDAEKIADRIADQLQLPEIDTTELAKESTLQEESATIQSRIDNIDLTPIENKVDEGVSTLSTKIDNIDLSSVAKQGDNPEATNTAILLTLQKVLDKSQQVIDYSGLVFTSGNEPSSAFDLAVNNYKEYLREVHDSIKSTFPEMSVNDYPVLEVFEVNAVEIGDDWMKGSDTLQVVKIPNIQISNNSFYRFIYNMTNIRVLDIEHCPVRRYNYNLIDNTPNLIDVVYGSDIAGSTDFIKLWNPTIALLNTIDTLVTDKVDEFGNSIENNLQQLLYNIRKHIASNLPTMTPSKSLNFTFHANVKAAILADEATTNAFTSKYWNVI